jgi:hypothetical protein
VQATETTGVLQWNAVKSVLCAKELRVKTLFQIRHPEPRSGNDVLLCEWGERYCCYTVYNQESRSLAGLHYFTFDQPASTEEIKEVIRQQKSDGRYSRVVFCSGFPQALLVPRQFFSDKASPVAVLTGEKSMSYFHDPIGEWQVVNNYAFPKHIYQQVEDAFGVIEMSHVYTTFLKTYNGHTAGAQVSVDFTPKTFRVIVKKEGQILLAQMYGYNTPLDVVYYLLKIFQELQLSKEETDLIVSGLIEGASAMYREMYNYFLNILFVQPPGHPLIKTEHPAHFFASIYNLALCVS